MTATQLKVEPEVVQRSGEQCSNIAPEIDTQVRQRLQVAGESVTPAEWTGVAREPFDTLHARLTQQSGALAEKVASLGLTLTQSAMGYLKADDLGVRLMSGQATPGGDWTLLDGNLVTGPSEVLARNLVNKLGKQQPAHTAAHHIVCFSKTQPPDWFKARAILAKYKIDLNDADNGVFISNDATACPGRPYYHKAKGARDLHTNKYAVEVLKRLEQADKAKGASAQTIRAVLVQIGKELAAGTFPVL